MPSGNFKRTLQYLDSIDSGGGRSTRTSFYNIAGNEENLRRWEKKLCEEWRIVLKKMDGDDRDYYVKTELGENLHKLFKSHEYVGSLFEELIRDRLRAGETGIVALHPVLYTLFRIEK